MDFLETIFRSAFSGHDFSVIGFSVVLFLLVCVQAVFMLTALVDFSEKEKVPAWALTVALITPLLIGLLTVALYATS